MKELRIKMTDVTAARLDQIAEEKNKTPSQIVEEHVDGWLNPQPISADRGQWKAYVTLKMRGLRTEEIAEQLDRNLEDLEEWDRSIREDPRRWREAYFQIRKATDPLSWEMKVKDKFIGLWGQKPE